MSFGNNRKKFRNMEKTNMKKNYLIAAGLLLACAWSMKNVDLSASKLAYAADQTTANTNFVVTSSNPDDEVFVTTRVNIAATNSVVSGQTAIASATVTLTGPVDTQGTPTAAVVSANGYTLVEYDMPHAKISGIIGENYDSATLAGKKVGSGNDGNLIDTGAGNTAGAWSTAKSLTDQASDRNLFGTSGVCQTSSLLDGSDRDGTADGDITFGGTSTQGYSCLFSTYIDNQASSATDGIVFTFTKD